MRPSFEGYRVLVTKASGQQAWVNLDREGAPTFLHDYSGGGNKGAIHAAKRESQQLTHPAQVGALLGGRQGGGKGIQEVAPLLVHGRGSGPRCLQHRVWRGACAWVWGSQPPCRPAPLHACSLLILPSALRDARSPAPACTACHLYCLQYGSNQVFEQMFQAFEQKVTRKGKHEYLDKVRAHG